MKLKFLVAAFAVGLVAQVAAGPLSEQFLLTAQSGTISKIFVVRRDGRNWHRLTNREGSESDATYSAARGEVFYRKLVANNWELAAWNVQTKEERILQRHPAVERQPVPSPDGSLLVFTSNRYGNDELMLLDLNQTQAEPVRLTRDQGQNSSPNWSPDGKSLVFSSRRNGQSDLYRLDLESGQQERLTATEEDEVDPHWSPDGNKILFQTTQTRYRQGLIGVLRLNDASLEYVSQLGGSSHQPGWSPDGNFILYLDYQSARNPVSPSLMLYSLVTREKSAVLLYRQGFDFIPWSFCQASWNMTMPGSEL